MLNAAEAAPRTFAGSGSKLAWIWMSALLSSAAPHKSAANWNAIRRCCPFVLPGLPPTGATGVGSLNPSLGPSALTTVMCALAAAGAGTARTKATSASGAQPAIRLKVFMALLLPARFGRLGQERHHFLDGTDALHVRGAVFVRPADEDMIESIQAHQRAAGRRRRLARRPRRHRGEGGHQFARFLLREVAQLAGTPVDANLAARQFDDRVVVAIVPLRLHASVAGPHHHDGGEPETEDADAHPSPLHEISP